MSKSNRTGFSAFVVVVDALEYQIVVPEPSIMTGFPLSVSLKIAVVLVLSNGVSLLATHTIVLGLKLLYHIQKYNRLCEFPKAKNPASNFPDSETRVSL